MKAPCLICQKNVQIIEVMTATIERLLKEKAIRNEALEEAQTKGKPMSILTEKEREDVYKYWLKSTTLTDEDGLIQITERAVLERVQAEILRKNEIMREAHRMLDAIFRHGVNGTFVTEHEAIIEKLSKELNK